jgi:hypothetical protein
MGVIADNAHDPAEQKFLRRFFQKAATFLYLSQPAWSMIDPKPKETPA